MKRRLTACSLLCLPLLACNGAPPNGGTAYQGGSVAAVANGEHSVGDFIDSAQLSDGRIVAVFGNESTGALNLAAESAAGSRNFDKALEIKPANRNIGLYNGIARDAQDNLHVVTHDSTRNALLYYKGGPQGLGEPEIVAQAPAGMRAHFGIWGSIAVDTHGEAHVSYYDATVGKPFHARRTTQGWQSQLAAPTDNQALRYVDFGRHSRIRLSDKKAWIACYNATEGDLWLLHANLEEQTADKPLIWELLVVDSQGDVGSWLDLELDKDGLPVISYYDATNGDLKLARPMQKNVEQRIRTLDTEGNVGLDTSLALDAAGNAHVAYLDGSRLNLSYTREDGAPERLDKNGVNGFFPALNLHGGDYTILYHLVTRREAQTRDVTEQKLLIWPPKA